MYDCAEPEPEPQPEPEQELYEEVGGDQKEEPMYDSANVNEVCIV